MDSPTVRMNLTAVNANSPVENAEWTAYKENGAVIGVASGDTTSLFEDMIGYATDNGFPVHVTGRTFRGADAPPGIDPNWPTYGIPRGTPMYMCWYRPVKLPPMICQSVILDNVGILSRPTNGGWGLEYDSFEDLTWHQRGGQFLYRGDAGAIRYNPSNPVPGDNAVTMNTGKIKWQAVTVQEVLTPGAHPVVVKFDLLNGSIFLNDIDHGEVDGTNVAQHAILVLQDLVNPNGFIFAGNRIGASTAYRTKAATVQVGNGFVNQANLKHNQWDFGLIQPGNNADGFNTFESYGTLYAGAIGSVTVAPAMLRGAVYNPGATSNRYRVGQFVPPYAQAVIDAGTDNIPL